jgi:multiple sugar transport system permease protein
MSEATGISRVSLPARWNWRRALRRYLPPFLFLLPTLALFAVIFVWPVFQAFRLSFWQWTLFRPRIYIGLANYERLLEDPLFWKSLWITAVWALGVVPAILVISLPIALLLNAPLLRLKGVWRMIYFIPVVTNIVAAAFIFRWLFDPQFGVVNWLLSLAGIKGPGWLADPDWALLAMMLVAVWKQIGYAAVLFLAGLQTIPQEFHEAALIDGATPAQSFWKVTFPLLNPTLVFVCVILLINAFRVFTIPFVMSAGGLAWRTVGGPLDSTRVFVLQIYDNAFARFDLGYGAANAAVLLVIIVFLTLIQMRVIQRPFEY